MANMKDNANKKKMKKPWVAETKSKPVYAINGWGIGTRYPSAREAARRLGLDQSTVTAVLRGRRKTTGGYRFKYAEEDK